MMHGLVGVNINILSKFSSYNVYFCVVLQTTYKSGCTTLCVSTNSFKARIEKFLVWIHSKLLKFQSRVNYFKAVCPNSGIKINTGFISKKRLTFKFVVLFLRRVFLIDRIFSKRIFNKRIFNKRILNKRIFNKTIFDRRFFDKRILAQGFSTKPFFTCFYF